MANANRGENSHLQKDLVFSLAHPAVTATSTFHVFKARVPCKVTRIEYANPTGLAEDTTNTFKGEIKNGSTVLATPFFTDSDEAGDNNLGANTLIVASLSAVDGALNLAAGDTLDLVLTEAGTATLPAGGLVVYVTEI